MQFYRDRFGVQFDCPLQYQDDLGVTTYASRRDQLDTVALPFGLGKRRGRDFGIGVGEGNL